MKRQVELSEISDGRLYTANDMVRADCRGCEGCSACCRAMGTSVVLDPLDIHRLCRGLHVSFAQLLETGVELHVVDGLVLPNLKMTGETEACTYLDAQGRCSIHAFRPGICRLFPLGRYYEEDGFKYFLQIHECKKDMRGKVKVKKWLETEQIKDYESYIFKWHNFCLACEQALQTLDEENARILTLYILRTFYQTPYGQQDLKEMPIDGGFYPEFEERLKETERKLGLSAQLNRMNLGQDKKKSPGRS